MVADLIFWTQPDGAVILIPARVAANFQGREATDAEIGAAHRESVLSPRPDGAAQRPPKKPCPRCPKSVDAAPADVRWLGLRWMGVPWPRRLRLRSPLYVAKLPGCGCIAPLKRWVEGRRLGRFARRPA